MDEKERISIRQKLKDDFVHYASRCLQIRSKSGEIKPLILNTAQKHIHKIVENQKLATGKVRVIILKGRQQGCSTLIEGRFYWMVTHHKGMRAFILTHDIEATNNLFDMAKRYHDNCPEVVKPKTQASNAKELIFGELDSGYKLGTAGNKSVGRSSTVQLLHASEAAFWPHADEHAKGLLQAVPSECNTEIFIESTANGIGGYFHEQWQLAEAGLNDFIPIFIPWFWQEEYRKKIAGDFAPDEYELELMRIHRLTGEQLAWRRIKIVELSAGGADGSKAFMQEYPCSSVEAFQTTGEDTFIAPAIVMSARNNHYEPVGNIVLGVDPARYGDDRTSIIRRCGRVAYNIQSYTKKDTMQVVGIVYQIIKDENPSKVCVDVAGLGAGVFDRLSELMGDNNDILIPVNGGNTPINQKLYYNKRAEMWGEMRQWLANGAEIPDIDSLHADLCGLKYKVDSNSRFVLERKEEMKKRGIRSPDEADALALTFALPFTALGETPKQHYQQIAKSLMYGYNQIDRARKNAYRK